jgi:hypothetical protein
MEMVHLDWKRMCGNEAINVSRIPCVAGRLSGRQIGAPGPSVDGGGMHGQRLRHSRYDKEVSYGSQRVLGHSDSVDEPCGCHPASAVSRITVITTRGAVQCREGMYARYRCQPTTQDGRDSTRDMIRVQLAFRVCGRSRSLV